MSEEDLSEVRRAAERMGRMAGQLENLEKRMARLERAILAVLIGGAALYLRSEGLLP